jgi:hypothetical protein
VACRSLIDSLRALKLNLHTICGMRMPVLRAHNVAIGRELRAHIILRVRVTAFATTFCEVGVLGFLLTE